jgi:putative ATP-binding cassette transporter
VELRAGERVLIVGESGTGKTLLFRALAGLWPWGSGRVSHPKGETPLYLPRTPYLPPGSLREVLAYPLSTGQFGAAACGAALARLGLERLVPVLDSTLRWDRDLNEDEQHSLIFARALLHAPKWLIIDEVLDTLDEDTLARVSDVLASDFAGAGIIHIGRSGAADRVFTRVLHLVKDPMSRRLSVASSARGAATANAAS